MSFVSVKHKDGRTAEITADEVAFYRSIGFTPVDGAVIDDVEVAQKSLGQLPTPVTATDQRLDLILDELRGLRADFAATFASVELDAEEVTDGTGITLREPDPPHGDTTSVAGAPSPDPKASEPAPDKPATTKTKK